MRPKIQSLAGEVPELHLAGDWTLCALRRDLPRLRTQLADLAKEVSWDLSEVDRLDSFGALLVWNAWGRRWPARLTLPEGLRPAIEAVARAVAVEWPRVRRWRPDDALVDLGQTNFRFVRAGLDFLALLGQLVLDWGRLLFQPAGWPLKEFSANLFRVGAQAMPVAGLVGFLIGVVLSYLSALQLKTFGADIYIVNILGLGIIRELGPVLVSVLVAGRSGSAMTAQFGVMRVTEEIDALAVMGISRHVRLVLPKVLALALAMPLLVVWTSALALFGGMVAANLELGLSLGFFVEALPKAVPIANLYIGLAKGVAFGLLISLVACHFGLKVKPNTESLSANTTSSVVSSITLVILVDAVFAIATRSIGMRL